MDIHIMMQSAGQYLYIALAKMGEWIGKAWNALFDYVASLPLPNAIKLFGNDMANKYLFFGFLGYILVMNIWSFSLFGADKSSAKRRQRRIREDKLFRLCLFGGATGGMFGMYLFHHKTLKKKFSVGVPIMFVTQLLLESFIVGFLGFWTFF